MTHKEMIKIRISHLRKINEIILHCSATPEGKDFTVADITRWHKERGFRTIGYHYVVYRDGTVHKGRPVEQIGAHCEGYNKNSIGVCYIGGLMTDGKTPKDTRTSEQKEALYQLCYDLMDRFDIGMQDIHCHNEYAKKACPSFQIQKFREEYLNWVNNKCFNKNA